jgi:hypothetical protein
MSDGCSVPKALRLVIPQETPAQVAVCVQHDRAYYEGGTRLDRAVADARLLLGLLWDGHMDVDLAERYHTAVRIFGKPHWDNGGGRYSDEPPEDPQRPAGPGWTGQTESP